MGRVRGILGCDLALQVISVEVIDVKEFANGRWLGLDFVGTVMVHSLHWLRKVPLVPGKLLDICGQRILAVYGSMWIRLGDWDISPGRFCV